MARIELAPEVLDDFERILADLIRHEARDPMGRIDEIIQAAQILNHSPLIGRPVRNGKRALVTGRGAGGYVALYRYAERIDTVFVLAVRGQREDRFIRER